jgi:hypothetical protein
VLILQARFSRSFVLLARESICPDGPAALKDRFYRGGKEKSPNEGPMIRLCAVIPNHILYAKNNKKSREKDVSICYMEPFSRFGKQLLRIADALTSGDDAPRIRGPRFGLTSVPHLRCPGR